ncbi:hypothetical protein Mapa_001057 [Marchantia paleacea]|nr:hypothetical protein Mapa_001057 [Marchantia paleacea]
MASVLKWHFRPSTDTPGLGRAATSGPGVLTRAAHVNFLSCKVSNCCCCCSSSSPSRLLSSSLFSSGNSRTLRSIQQDFDHLKCKLSRRNSQIEALMKGVDYEFNEEGANLEVRVPLPPVKDGGVQYTARYVAVDAQSNSLCVGVQTPQGIQILLNASSLYGRIQPHETVWFVDETEVVLSLQKADKEQLWPDLVQAWESLAKGVASQLQGASVYIVGDSTEVNLSVAQELAAGLEYTPLHTQQLIEHLANVTVDRISEEEGEDAVAGAEGAVMNTLSQHVRCVVATLGGSCGAAYRQDGWKCLHSGFTIWLSQSRAQDEDSAKEEAVKAKQEGNLTYSKADVVVALSGWDDDAVRPTAEGALKALKYLLDGEKDLPGKKALYVRLGCRGDWPEIMPPGWDPNSPQDKQMQSGSMVL